MPQKTFIITPDYANQRLDRFLRKRYKNTPSVTLSTIYQWIRTGQVKINGRRAKEQVKVLLDDEVTLPQVESQKSNESKVRSQKSNAVSKKSANSLTRKLANPQTIASLILYEDDNRIVRNKPPHIVIHANVNTGSDLTMHEMMELYRKEKTENREQRIENRGQGTVNREQRGGQVAAITDRYISSPQSPASSTSNNQGDEEDMVANFQPGKRNFCFRLDRDTSGILIAAKTFAALQHLNELIRERKVHKEYCTIVTGVFPSHQLMTRGLTKVVDKKFSRGKMVIDPEGKPSKTEARCQKTRTDEILGQLSFLRVAITTGRMHQIRVHLAHAGHVVVGDLVYGHPMTNRKLHKKYTIKRQLLHCQKYAFTDLDGKKLSFEAPVPDDMGKLLCATVVRK